MGVVGAYDRNLEFDEIQNSVDVGSGAKSIVQRQTNAQFNLGLIPTSTGSSGGTGWATVDAESSMILASNFGLQNVNTAQKAFNLGSSTNGAFNVAAGATYVFEACYNITNTGTTSHTWATLFGGTASFTIFQYQVFGNSVGTANTAASGGLSGFSISASTAVVATPASVSATEQVTLEIVGYLKVNVAGTIIPQVQLSAAPGGTQTMLAGSFIRFWQVPNGAVGNFT